MKIMIVDENLINSSKLKLVFSKYGDCEVLNNGSETLEIYQKSHQISDPYQLIALDMDLKAIKSIDIFKSIRVWEEEQKKTYVKILLIISAEDQEKLKDFLSKESTYILNKPYNRKKLEMILDEIGMEKEEKKPLPTKSNKNVEKKLGSIELDALLKKITALITKTTPAQFRQMRGGDLIRGMIQQGGNDAAMLVGNYMTAIEIPLETRQELVQLAGKIKHPHLLIPLNKLINSEENIKMIQGAFLAVAKYNNQKALNILNQGLQKFKHPMLLNTLRGEVARIKQNNPLLAILPRFLQIDKSLKNYRVTIDIIKKIIKPEDADLFIFYLKSGKTAIENGAFEILCYLGEESLKTTLLNFFEDRIQKIQCVKESTCDEVYNLLSQLYRYFQKNSHLIDQLLSDLKELFNTIMDIRARHIIISLICRSQRSDSLEFVKSIYNQEIDFQEHIIDELSGNQEAVDFLFEKYKQGHSLKEKVIVSLLKSDQGLEYFIKHFFTFELEKQELILKNIPFNKQDFLMEFIKNIYDSELYSLKFQLLKLLKENFLFDFEGVLFDEDNQREFMFMGKEYLETINQLFPLTSLKMFYFKIANEELSNTKIKKYLEQIKIVSGLEPVLYFNDTKLINNLFNRILNANNPELTSQFFQTFESLKILDLQSYRYLLEAVNKFVEARGENLTAKEKQPISKLKAMLRDQLPDIRDIQQLPKQLNSVFISKPIEREKLEKLIENNHIGVSVKIHHLAAYLSVKLSSESMIKKNDLELFKFKFPFISDLMKKISSETGFTPKEDWSDIESRKEILKHFRDKLRVVITFKSNKISAFIRDQLREFYPELQVIVNTNAEFDDQLLKDTDRLVCDPYFLRQLIEKNSVKTKRIYLFLESRLDFAPFRDYGPKVFMKPLSGHRVIRLLLQDLFL